MSSTLTRSSIGRGIHFGSVRDSKFKHNRLSVNFILPLEEENASHNAVVPFILRKGYKACPDFTSLNARLAELYGAELDADVAKHGGWQVLEISLRGLDNRFALENEDITGQCARLLASIVLDPHFEQGLFAAKDVELERQYVLDTIEAEINDKRSYALAKCIQAMCAGEPVAVRRYGSKETAEKISRESATAAYHRMVKTAPIEILFTGSGDPQAAMDIFKEEFARAAREPVELAPLHLREKAGEVKQETQEMDITQAKLVLGMRTGPAKDRRAMNARRLFSALYGGTPFSKLFLNVREKLSLCYYCASRYDVSTKLLLVDSGIEKGNKEKAQEEILKQLKAVQSGDFTSKELEDTKLLMKNSIASTADTLVGLEGWYLAHILRGDVISPEDDLRYIDEVTKEDVLEAANAVTLDTVYFLTGKEG